jgi:hypothetical protein
MMPLEAGVAHMLVGTASMQRLKLWGFPSSALGVDGSTVALLGRMGYFRIYFGRGQRVELADGGRWTVTSISTGGSIRPLIVDESGRRVATAGLNQGTYGLNGRDYACVLHPADAPRFGRANHWMLTDGDQVMATVTRSPLSVSAHRPVHLGAVLLSFLLVRFGLPEESAPRVPSFRWAAR